MVAIEAPLFTNPLLWDVKWSPSEDFGGVWVSLWVIFECILAAKMGPKAAKNTHQTLNAILNAFCLHFDRNLPLFLAYFQPFLRENVKTANMWILTTVHAKSCFLPFQRYHYRSNHRLFQGLMAVPVFESFFSGSGVHFGIILWEFWR